MNLAFDNSIYYSDEIFKFRQNENDLYTKYGILLEIEINRKSRSSQVGILIMSLSRRSDKIA